MKVLFVLAYTLEALGVDFGIGRLLLTFLLQCVGKTSSHSVHSADYHVHVASSVSDCLILDNQKVKQIASESG